MTATSSGSGSGSGQRTDILLTAGVMLCGGALLWCGTRLLPSAAAAGGDLLASPNLSAGPAPSSVLILLAGFSAAAAGVMLTLWWVAGALCVLTGYLLHRIGFHTAGSRALSLAPGPLRRISAATLGLSLAAAGIPAQAATASGLQAPPAAALPVAAPAAAIGALPVEARPVTFPPVSADAGLAAGPAESDASADTAEEISPLWRPLPPQPAGSNLVTGTPLRNTNEVVVTAGDTLWSLAAQQLGPLATDAEIASLWPRWYELNRLTIGPDPGLIHPGQVLSVPPP